MKTKTDEELMCLYGQKANEAAFTELYRRYAAKLYGFLKNKAQGQVDIEAVFQETFMKLHQAKKRYKAEYPFSAWFFTICRNTLTDHFRKKDRLQTVTDKFQREQETPTIAQPLADSLPPRDAMHQLPAGQRKAVELRYLEQLPFETIAKELEKSEGNVRQMVSRGVRRLRFILEKI